MKFEKANKRQLEAIKHKEGALLIVAGPGTGKTYTLINRAINLIVNEGVEPSKILFATFTEKAARELITRLSNALAENGIEFNANEMYIGTFHSICLRILKDNIAFADLKKNFSLKDQFDQQYFIYQNYSLFSKVDNFDEYIQPKQPYWIKCEKIVKIINKFTEEMIDKKLLMKSKDKKDRFCGTILDVYDELREKANFVDFSSIQVETYKMIVKYKEIAKKLIDSIDYVMVDEYQDTNYIQERLSLLFASKHNNICVVGDDDQALYRFRGATVRNILEFEKHFKDCKRVELVDNYRSHKDIVKFYNEWMDITSGRGFSFEWKDNRFKKKIKAAKKSTLEEPTVIKINEYGMSAVCKKAYEVINKLIKTKKIKDLNQIAFLFKSVKHSSAIVLANYLENKGIPTYSPRSNMFFDREETKLLLGTLIFMFPKFYMRLQNGDEKLGIDISSYLGNCIRHSAKILQNKKYKEFVDWMQRRVKDHINVRKALDYSFSGLIYQMLEFKPFRDLLDVNMDGKLIDTRTVRNIGLFIQLVVKFEYLNNLTVFTEKTMDKFVDRFFGQYIKFLHEGGITEYEDEEEYAPSGCISFMTIHQSKGLEFPIVFIGSQYAIPTARQDEDIQETIDKYSKRRPFEEKNLIKFFDFCRLFYVGFSRAQSLLITVSDRSNKGEPSKYFERFYSELPEKTDLSKFEFEEIKKGSLKYSYSFTSDINVYLTCPTQYKYFKVLGFEPVRVGSTLFGTVVHETIEDVHKAVLKGEKETITKENIEKWFEINYETASKLNNSYMSETNQKSAISQVMAYVDRASKNWDAIYDAEKMISLSRENYILTGKVDLIRNDAGKFEVLDFKTEKKPDLNKEKDKIAKVKMQLEVYSHLIEKTYGIDIAGMKVYYTSEKSGNPYISFKRDEGNINKTLKVFDSVVKNIESNNFKGTCNNHIVCSNCDLRHFCKRS